MTDGPFNFNSTPTLRAQCCRLFFAKPRTDAREGRREGREMTIIPTRRWRLLREIFGGRKTREDGRGQRRGRWSLAARARFNRRHKG